MATHCSILAWRIPRTEKPGEIHSSWGLKESEGIKHLSRHSEDGRKQGICLHGSYNPNHGTIF